MHKKMFWNDWVDLLPMLLMFLNLFTSSFCAVAYAKNVMFTIKMFELWCQGRTKEKKCHSISYLYICIHIRCVFFAFFSLQFRWNLIVSGWVRKESKFTAIYVTSSFLLILQSQSVTQVQNGALWSLHHFKCFFLTVYSRVLRDVEKLLNSIQRARNVAKIYLLGLLTSHLLACLLACFSCKLHRSLRINLLMQVWEVYP